MKVEDEIHFLLECLNSKRSTILSDIYLKSKGIPLLIPDQFIYDPLFALFMPPTSKKFEGHIASGGLSVRPFVTLFDA